jgi:hypothetical protein
VSKLEEGLPENLSVVPRQCLSKLFMAPFLSPRYNCAKLRGSTVSISVLQLTYQYLFSSMQIKLKLQVTQSEASSYFELLGSNLPRQVRSMRSDKVTWAIRWHPIPPSASSYSRESMNWHLARPHKAEIDPGVPITHVT